MRERLPKDVFQRLMRTIKKGEKLDHELADIVAFLLAQKRPAGQVATVGAAP